MSKHRSKGARKKNKKISATKKTNDAVASAVSSVRRKTCSKLPHNAKGAKDTLETATHNAVPKKMLSAPSAHGDPLKLQKLRSHSGNSENDKRRCDVCFVQFSNHYNLQRHLVRFGKPRYPCVECGTKFPDHKQLNNHVKNAHTNIKEQTTGGLACPFCGQIIPKRYLQSHVYHYHNEGAQRLGRRKTVVATDEKPVKKGESCDGKRRSLRNAKVVPSGVEDPPTALKTSTKGSRQCAANQNVKSFENSQIHKSLKTAEPLESEEDKNCSSARECDSGECIVDPEVAKHQDVGKQDCVVATIEHSTEEQPAAQRQGGEIETEGSLENPENNGMAANIDNHAATDTDVDDNSQLQVCKPSVPQKYVQDENEEQDRRPENTFVEDTEQMNAVHHVEKSTDRFEGSSKDSVICAEDDEDEVSLYDRCLKRYVEKDFQGPSKNGQFFNDSGINCAQVNRVNVHVIDDRLEKNESQEILNDQGKSDVIDDEKEKSTEVLNDQSVVSTSHGAPGENDETAKPLEVLENGEEKAKPPNDQSLAPTRFNDSNENNETAQSLRLLRNGEESETSESAPVMDPTISNSPEEISEHRKIEIAENGETSDNLSIIDNANHNAPMEDDENEELRGFPQDEATDKTDYDRVPQIAISDEIAIANEPIDDAQNGEEIDETTDDQSTNTTSSNEPEEADESEEIPKICGDPIEKELEVAEKEITEKSSEIIKECESIDKSDSMPVKVDDEEDHPKNPKNSNPFTTNETASDISPKRNVRPKRRSRGKSTIKTRIHSMPKTVKVNRLNRKKFSKNRSKRTATKLHAVLAEVAAIFSTIDVQLPQESDETMKLREIKKIEEILNNIENDSTLGKIDEEPFINDIGENYNMSQKIDGNQPEKPVLEEMKIVNVENGESHVETADGANIVNENSYTAINEVLEEIEALSSDKSIDIIVKSDENICETLKNVEMHDEIKNLPVENKNVSDENLETIQISEIVETSAKIDNNNATQINDHEENAEEHESKISHDRESISELDNSQIIHEKDVNGSAENLPNCESEIPQNPEKINALDGTRIFNDTGINLLENHLEKCESKVLQPSDEITNSDNIQIFNETSVNGSEKKSENDESEILPNRETIAEPDKPKIISESITKLDEENCEEEESKISKNSERIDDPKGTDDPKITNGMSVHVLEENSKDCKLEIAKNCEKIDDPNGVEFIKDSNFNVPGANLEKCELEDSQNCKKIVTAEFINAPNERSEKSESMRSENMELDNLSNYEVTEKTIIAPDISKNLEIINDPGSTGMQEATTINSVENSEKIEISKVFDEPLESIEILKPDPENAEFSNTAKNHCSTEIIDKTRVDISQETPEKENLENSTSLKANDDEIFVKPKKPKMFEKLYKKFELLINAGKNDASSSDSGTPRTRDTGKKNAFERDNDLRKHYDCKHCYVSITRLKMDRWNSSLDGYERISSTSVLPSSAYWCIHCCVAFSSKEKRQCHTDDRHTMITSKICNKIFTTMSSMRRHCRERHDVGCDENETCVCGKHMHSRETLDRHFYDNCQETTIVAKLRKSLGNDDCTALPKLNACPTCDRDFWLKSCLDIHRLDCKRIVDGGSSSTRPELPRLVPMRKEVIRRKFGQGPITDLNERACRICRTEFTSSIGLLKHEVTYARDERLPCGYCGTIFCRVRLLKAHAKATHTPGVEVNYPFHCAICNQGFATKIHRHIHMTHIHGEKYPEISMANRQTSFDQTIIQRVPTSSDNSTNRQILRERDKLDDLPGGQCPICGLVFTSRKRFIDHVIYFKNDEIINCHLCKLNFEGQHAAHRHNKLVHYNDEMAKAYPHRCYLCKEGFVYRRHLRAHFCHVHDKKPDEISLVECKINGVRPTRRDNNPGLCTVCEMSFDSVQQLVDHQMDQLNDGKFVCARCSKKCRTALQLLDHLSLNHSSATHDNVQCRRCDEIFLTPLAWMSHVKHAHAVDSREPSEFYLETNASSSKQFGDGNYDLVPASADIASGTTYTLVRDKLDEILAEKRDSALPESLVTTKRQRKRMDDTDEVEVVEIDDEPISEAQSQSETQPKGQNITDRRDLRNKVPDKDDHRFPCRVCGVRCHDAIELSNHHTIWSDEGPHLCGICGRRFTLMRFYQEHRIKHFRQHGRKDNYCRTCKEAFESPYFMKMHMAHLHTGKENDDRRRARLLNLHQTTTATNNPAMPCARINESSSQSTSADNAATSSSGPLESAPVSETTSDDTVDIVYENIPDLFLGKAIAKPITYSYQCLKCMDVFSSLEVIHEHNRMTHPANGHRRLENANGNSIQEYLQKKLQQLAGSALSSSGDDSLDIVYDKMADRPHDKGVPPKRVIYTYKCPDCPKEEASLEKLWIHHKTIHKARFGQNDGDERDSAKGENDKSDEIGDDSTRNDTQITKIGAKRKLNETESLEAIIEKNPSGLKHYRIYKGKNIVPISTSSLPTKMDEPKNSEKIGVPSITGTLRCDICECPMDSEDSLRVHKTRFHSIMQKPSGNNGTPGEPIVPTMDRSMVQIQGGDEARPLGKNIVLPLNIQHKIASLLAIQQSKLQSTQKVSLTVVQSPPPKPNGVSVNSPEFKCSHCNEVFRNAGLRKRHVAAVHSTLPAIPEVSRVGVVGNNYEKASNNNSIKYLSLLVNTLPILTGKSKDSITIEQPQSTFHFEPVMIPISENRIDGDRQKIEISAVENVTSNRLVPSYDIRTIDQIIGNVRQRIADSTLCESQNSKKKFKRR